jgi:hypothetical protein
MHVNEQSLAALRFMLPLLEAMPAKCDIDFGAEYDGEVLRPHISIQAHTQEDVRQVRHLFPGVTVWVKQWNKGCAWLEYTTAIGGVTINIYACHEAPAMCEIVEVEEEVEEDVPVTFEKQLVKRTVRRMVCP